MCIRDSRYTVLRVALFFACFGVLWLLGMRSQEQQLLAVAGAAVISMVLSFIFLRPLQQDISDKINARVSRRIAQQHERDQHGGAAVTDDFDAAAEDAEAEASERKAD